MGGNRLPEDTRSRSAGWTLGRGEGPWGLFWMEGDHLLCTCQTRSGVNWKWPVKAATASSRDAGKKTENSRLHGLAGCGPADFMGPCRHPLGPRRVLRAHLESQTMGACTDLLAGNTPGRPTPGLSTATCDLATLGVTKATTGERFPKVCPRRFKPLTLIRSRTDTKIQRKALWFRARPIYRRLHEFARLVYYVAAPTASQAHSPGPPLGQPHTPPPPPP